MLDAEFLRAVKSGFTFFGFGQFSSSCSSDVRDWLNTDSRTWPLDRLQEEEEEQIAGCRINVRMTTSSTFEVLNV